MWLVFVEKGMDGHPGLSQRFTCASNIIVYFVEDALWRYMSLVKLADQLIHTVPQCTVFMVEVLVQRVFLEVLPNDLNPFCLRHGFFESGLQYLT